MFKNITKIFPKKNFRNKFTLKYKFNKNYLKGSILLCTVAASSFFTYNAIMEGETTESSEKKILSQNLRKKVFGNYENKVRETSAPQKIFDYFASVWSDESKEWFMTPEDFIRSITPFHNYSSNQTTGKSTRKIDSTEVKKFLNEIDLNNDGLISYSEYIFFITLLTIPRDMVEIAFKMFDKDGNGEVDAREFTQVMKVMRKMNKVASASRDGGSLSQVKKRTIDVVPAFFGKDGNGTLKFEDFQKFMDNLFSSILVLEFNLIDSKSVGQISYKDFGASLLSFGDTKFLNRYSNKLDTLPDKSLTFQEFKDFHSVIENIEVIDRVAKLFLTAGKDFGKKEFKIAARAASGIDLSDNHIDLIFHLFDIDGDGRISFKECLKVLKGKKNRGLTKPRDFGFERFINCTKKCSNTTN